MRRKAGALLPIEIACLRAGIVLRRAGNPEFHAYVMAREISDRDGARSLVAHGTLYRALARLEIRGLLATRWEDPRIAAAERRPRRRMYRVTAESERAVPSMTEPTEAPVPMRSLRDETGGGRGIAAVENAAYL